MYIRKRAFARGALMGLELTIALEVLVIIISRLTPWRPAWESSAGNRTVALVLIFLVSAVVYTLEVSRNPRGEVDSSFPDQSR